MKLVRSCFEISTVVLYYSKQSSLPDSEGGVAVETPTATICCLLLQWMQCICHCLACLSWVYCISAWPAGLSESGSELCFELLISKLEQTGYMIAGKNTLKHRQGRINCKKDENETKEGKKCGTSENNIIGDHARYCAACFFPLVRHNSSHSWL